MFCSLDCTRLQNTNHWMVEGPVLQSGAVQAANWTAKQELIDLLVDIDPDSCIEKAEDSSCQYLDDCLQEQVR